VRAGYQIISIGRFDFWSATNFLTMLDLRNGPATMPEATEVAQPALRTDIDISQALTLQAFYVPFFQPHLVSLIGTDYSILKGLETDDASAELVRTTIARAVDRSDISALTSDATRALAPRAGPEHPQAALRLTARSDAGELAFTAGTALERLPAFELSPELEAFLLDPDPARAVAAAQSDKPIRVVHNRFTVLALDGATDIGPFQVGLETAYMQNRTLYAARPDRVPRPGSSDIGQAALRLELAEADVAGLVEGFYAYAFDEPGDPERRFQLLEDGRWLRGVAAAVHWALGQSGLALDLFGLVAVGPSYFFAPRVEWQALDGFYVELGGFIFEGPEKGAFDPEISLGGVYDDADQVFVGLRFLP
jgi:hypothetical protein